jgi:hypothetical protein
MFKGIISILLLIAAGAVFFMFTRPLYSEIKEFKNQKSSFEEALSNTKQIQEKRDQLLTQYNTISKENLDRLDSILPSQPGAMEFILEIESVAQKNGMVLKKVDIKGVAETSGKVDFGAETKKWETVPLALKLSGSYKSFYLFLKDMEKSLRLTDINAITFSSGETDFYEFNVDGTFYQISGTQNTQLSQTKDILDVLSLLKTINLDLDFLNNPAFKGLDDFSVELPAPELGKNNPFAP